MTMAPRQQTRTFTTAVTFGVLLAVALSIPVPSDGGPRRYTKTVVEGDNLLIVCNITAQPAGLDVYWTRNDSKSSFYVQGPKLEFVNIKRTSSGDYVCHVLTTPADNRTVEVATIDVQYPAEITGMHFGPNTITENQTWTGGASVHGNPGPDFNYYNIRTGTSLASGTSSIESFSITSWPARCADAGEYHVAARNPLNHGVWEFQASNLTVLCTPIPDPDRRITYTEKSSLGQKAVFHMNYVGYPAPTVQWEHSGVVLPSSMQQNAHNETSLSITNVAVDDFGDYTATLSNNIGTSTTKFTLQAEGAPVRPYNLFYYNVTYNSVTLRWTSGFDMGSQQHFNVYQKVNGNTYIRMSDDIMDTSSNHGVNQTWTYILRGLRSDTEYTLTVQSKNNRFESGYVDPPKHVTTHMPSAGGPHRYTKTVVEGDNLLLVCNVTSQPAGIDVYWTRNDSKSSFYVQGQKLEFVNIKRTSSGDYVCHVLTTPADNRTVEVATIDVQYPAEVTGMHFGPNTITENQTWTGGASVHGNPGPDFKYYNIRTGRGLVSGTSSIESFSVTSWPARCADAGEYHVAARNPLNHGVWAFQASNLTVFCTPIPDPDRRITYTEKASLGQNAAFHMEYVGYPAPTVQWEHSGVVLPSSMQQNVHNETSLSITNVAVDDFGDYTVTLSNNIGTSTTKFTLQAEGAPVRPYNLFYYNVTYNSVTLRWTSGFDMGSQQHFNVYQKVNGNTYIRMSGDIMDTSSNHGVNQTWTYILRGLQSDTEYTLTVQSKNNRFESGYVDPPKHVTTHTMPRQPHHGNSLAVILGPSVGGLCVLGLAAFVVYLLRYRRMRTSYVTMKK